MDRTSTLKEVIGIPVEPVTCGWQPLKSRCFQLSGPGVGTVWSEPVAMGTGLESYTRST